MSYTQSIILWVNTPEVRRRFEDLGYKPLSISGDIIITWSHHGCYGALYKERLLIALLDHKPFDCGTNIELALALAALRDDSDDHQWFVSDHQMSRYDPVYIDDHQTQKETWRIEKGDYILFGEWPMKEFNKFFHKATPEELIKYFRKEG